MTSDRTPDFPTDAIAALRARFGKKEPASKAAATTSREDREHKARNYGDGRRRKRGKKTPSKTYVQVNLKVSPEFRDLLEELADNAAFIAMLGEDENISMTAVIKQSVYFFRDHLTQEDEKAIS